MGLSLPEQIRDYADKVRIVDATYILISGTINPESIGNSTISSLFKITALLNYPLLSAFFISTYPSNLSCLIITIVQDSAYLHPGIHDRYFSFFTGLFVVSKHLNYKTGTMPVFKFIKAGYVKI